MGKLIDETGNKYGAWTVLELVKKDNKSYWLCECECGTQRLILGSYLRKGKTKSCGCQRNINRHIDITNQRFGRLIALYPINLNSGKGIKWHCKCDCGNETDVALSSLRQGSTKSCGCLHKELASEANKKNIIGQKFGLWTVLEELPERNENQKIVYKCKCDCGTIKNVVGGNLLNGLSQSCGCLNMSHGELKIHNLLTKNNIDFIQEYHPENSDIFQNARYDFYIPSQKLLIEYDGKQHFQVKGSGWNESFEEIQKRDSKKNEWALKNGFTLIRIPYTRYDDLCIEDLMVDTSSFIYKK